MSETAVTVPAKTGRPTNYRDEYPDMLVDYFTSRLEAIQATPVSELPANEQGGKGSSRAAAQRIYSEFPTLAGFAASIGTHEQRIYEWSNRHPALAEARAHVVSITKHMLVNGMLDGRYNAQAAQFVAKNLTDMKDKVEVENTNSQDSQDMGNMRAALAAATPEQLAAFGKLIADMQGQARIAGAGSRIRVVIPACECTDA